MGIYTAGGYCAIAIAIALALALALALASDLDLDLKRPVKHAGRTQA
jgi:hypothetical protein